MAFLFPTFWAQLKVSPDIAGFHEHTGRKDDVALVVADRRRRRLNVRPLATDAREGRTARRLLQRILLRNRRLGDIWLGLCIVGSVRH